MAYYTRYEKLQKYYKDGIAVVPAEYKKGANLGVAEYSSIEECQGQPEPVPGNYTCCITWESSDGNINFTFNYHNVITTEENPWCTKEKITELHFTKSQSKIESLDVTVDETNSLTSMYLAFGAMPYLRSVKLNMPKAASLSDISNMFEDSTNLTSINFINFDTSNVTTAAYAFRHCSSLTSLDLSNWNTGNLTHLSQMFGGCSSLSSIDVSNWNTGNFIEVGLMFDGCSSLSSLDLSNWNTGKVKGVKNMFSGCSSLSSLNLKNFDMSKATSYDGMFGGCNNLKNIICKQAFKDWCITNQDEIVLPAAMREGGTGTWTIVN